MVIWCTIDEKLDGKNYSCKNYLMKKILKGKKACSYIIGSLRLSLRSTTRLKIQQVPNWSSMKLLRIFWNIWKYYINSLILKNSIS